MQGDNMKKDLAGVLKALESNNAPLSPEEKSKRENFVHAEVTRANSSLIKPLRTFESDAADFIKQEQQSVYSISQAEKAKIAKKKESDPEKEEVKKNGLLLLLSGVLFLAGAAFILYFLLLRGLAKQDVVPQAQIINSWITSQYEIKIDDSEKAKDTITTGIQNTLSENPRNRDEVENITIVRNTDNVDIADILSSLSESVPSSLLRSFDSKKYMIGNTQKDQKKLFLILKVNYYDNAFAGMLAWEKELGTTFLKLSGLPNTTNEFRDGVIKNQDTRILRDDAGNSIILYTFYDKETLIIAANEETLFDVVSGLRASKLVR